jgi:hypothetical protein
MPLTSTDLPTFPDFFVFPISLPLTGHASSSCPPGAGPAAIANDTTHRIAAILASNIGSPSTG